MEKSIDCNTLRMGQYLCPDPDYDLVDPKTQQIRGCTKENKAKGTGYCLRFLEVRFINNQSI